MANFLNKIRRKPIRVEAKWGCKQKGSFSEEKNDELTYPIPGARCIGCPEVIIARKAAQAVGGESVWMKH